MLFFVLIMILTKINNFYLLFQAMLCKLYSVCDRDRCRLQPFTCFQAEVGWKGEIHSSSELGEGKVQRMLKFKTAIFVVKLDLM